MVLGEKMLRSRWIGVALLGWTACSTAHSPVAGSVNPCPVPGIRPGEKCDPSRCPPRPASWSHRHWGQPIDCTERERTECELNEELRTFVVTRQSCTVDTDCSIILPMCPFGCGIPVAGTHEAAVRTKLDDLTTRVRFPCKYMCHLTSKVVCDDGRCVDATPDCLPNQMLQPSGSLPRYARAGSRS
jgi:hypothetical protein